MSRLHAWLRAGGPGLALCVLVALAARFLSDHYGAPVMLLALLLGMAFNVLSLDGPCQQGIEIAARHVLRIGVALLGLRITLDEVTALGWQPVVTVVLAVAFVLALGVVVARWLGFRVFFGLLTGGAVGICGASAALAIAAALPDHPLKERATLLTVVGVSAMSTIAMVCYPMLTQWMGLTDVQAGFFLGATIHDVAQVVGAGYSVSRETGDTAALVKLMRVGLLLPVIALVAWITARHEATRRDAGATTRRPPVLPGFAVAFAALVLVHSVGWLPPALISAGQAASFWCLAVAMAALGMKTHVKAMVNVGWRPILLLVIETIGLALFVMVPLAWDSRIGEGGAFVKSAPHG